MARYFSGTEYPTIVMPPEKRPEAPAPAIARPTMSIGELIAVAQTMEPTSKSAIAPR